MNSREVLKKYFGYDTFRKGQEEIIESILSGQDALAVMPTGAGKSICYQIPALMMPGITLVISPLISLMQDQVKALNDVGINAAYINSSLSDRQVSLAIKYASEGSYKIIYVAPERLESREFLGFAYNADISMITVDEAHCISQWGQDFRPSYLKIIDFIKKLPKRPVISAFTATATKEVKEDIACVLNLYKPFVVVTGFDRENLYYTVEHTREKDRYVLDFIRDTINDSGIIYAATRKNVDKLYELLFKSGVAVSRYHAGMDTDSRKKSQDDFIYDRTPVIVATNAFGMGIDKSNVRFVIHYNMPQSMENYYQEAGRAGRDGEISKCILLFSPQDIMINKFLIEKREASDLDTSDLVLVKKRDLKRLSMMEGYARTTGCLRNYILEYFGEKVSSPCENCGNCHRDFKKLDMTNEAKSVINCVAETKGRYGINVVIGTLLGANRARLRELGTVNYKTYGTLKEMNEKSLRTLISQLIEEGYLVQTNEEYSVLKMGDISPLYSEETRVVVKTYDEMESIKGKNGAVKKSTDRLTSKGYELFEILKRLRTDIAREKGLPPYIVFNDKTLIDMCVKLPISEQEFLNVSGVGQRKYESYGDAFKAKIEEFVKANPGIKQNSDTHYYKQDDSELEITKVKRKKNKKRKVEFYLNEEDGNEFNYSELYYISDIKNELNRICSVENAKKVTTKLISEFLISENIIYKESVNGFFVKCPTAKGREIGVITEDRVSAVGNAYKVIKYPETVQRRIVKHFIDAIPNIIRDEEDGGLEKDKTFNRGEYNRLHNRPECAGASWSEEEDARLEEEFKSDLSISEIARLHGRTKGGIRARLKKHGYEI